jgi:Bifunctional DNA primase/polymerase, N-terminal
MNALLDAALGYAARGIPVYPVHWPHPTPSRARLACSCSHGLACDRPAKHPLVRHGVKEATTDPDRIGRWWRRRPQANLGLATDICFDVLDIAGLTALRQLAGTVDLRFPGPLVATGGGGWHHWFASTRQPARGPRIPPGPARPRPADHHPANPHSRPGHARPPLRPPGPGRPRPGHPGQRNHTLNQTAFKVYRYVAAGVLSDGQVTAAFTEAARAIGLTAAETARTLASARTAGLANPRTIPATPDPSCQEAGS